MAAAPSTTPPSAPARLLTRRDVAELVRLSVRTIERLDEEGEGPAAIRIGKSIRYAPDSIARWLESRSGRRNA